MSSTTDQWVHLTDHFVWCADCGAGRSRLEFYNPDTVYCEGCDRIVGRTTTDVEWGMVGLSVREGVVKDAETDDVHADVEWDSERVEWTEREDR